VFSGSQRDYLWGGLEGHVVSKLVRKIVTRHHSCARSTGRINSTTNWSPFEIVYVLNLLTPLDCMPNIYVLKHKNVQTKVDYVRKLHKKVKA